MAATVLPNLNGASQAKLHQGSTAGLIHLSINHFNRLGNRHLRIADGNISDRLGSKIAESVQTDLVFAHHGRHPGITTLLDALHQWDLTKE